MMPFAAPKFTISFDVDAEIKALDQLKQTRKIPAKSASKLLVATWNLANFGLQKRKEDHFRLIAYTLQYFDVVALQEIADDITHLEQLLALMGPSYDCIYSDIGGNVERAAYIYDTKKVSQKGLIAELVIKTSRTKEVEVTVGDHTETESFQDFNRNPYMVNFVAKNFNFTLVNVHLYWSSEFIRAAEVKALGAWAKGRARLKESQPPSNDIILLGDFNMPSFDADDPIYAPIKRYGFKAPLHETHNAEGSNLAGDKYYDQVFFLPKHTEQDFSKKIGVFDFDNALFANFWGQARDDKKKRQQFHQYIRYYLSDHRPLWCQFDLNA
jgi:endonuclease/exonuclease/phosphatase family metal-dependent hydrolase